MKQKKKILLTAAIMGVVALGWFAISFYVHYMNTMLRSSVKAPVRFALQEICDDMNNGQYNTAKEKLYILMRAWNDYFLYNGVAGHAFSNTLREFNTIAHCDESLQIITPVLSNRFGKLVVVNGNVVRQKLPRRKNGSSQDILIHIHCVDGRKIDPQTMPLYPVCLDVEDSMKLIINKSDVKLMGYEFIECVGFPSDMEPSVQSESFSIKHGFIVTKIYNEPPF